MPDTAYDGIYGFPFSFTFTPITGTPFGSAQAQVEEANTPPLVANIAKFIPISGANFNKEQFAIGAFPVQEYKMKVTYSQDEHDAARTCWAAKSKGTLVCTYGDGSSETYTGAAVTSVAPGPVTATNIRTAEITFTCPVPPAFAKGS